MLLLDSLCEAAYAASYASCPCASCGLPLELVVARVEGVCPLSPKSRIHSVCQCGAALQSAWSTGQSSNLLWTAVDLGPFLGQRGVQGREGRIELVAATAYHSTRSRAAVSR